MPGLLPSVAPSLPRFANRVPGAPEFSALKANVPRARRSSKHKIFKGLSMTSSRLIMDNHKI